ncbi:MAG TPA: SPOR domain-containing protein [Burkholderiales bacterium]|nr:SPOR domain-containing protein [Burkholderiales bacterium]
MRIAFLLLVAANLALYAWFQHYSPAESAVDPEPVRRQISPEKIRLLEGKESTGLAPPAAKSAGIKPAASAPAGTAPTATAPAGAGSTGSTCIEWGGFALSEAPKAEQALAPLALGARLSQRRSEETAGWWVYIPPQGNRPAAIKKTAELKALGIDDYFVLQDEGKMRWAVSLGVFSSEDAAKSRLDALRAKGVRSALMGERETQVPKIWFQLRGADAPLQARFRETAPGFPGTDIHDCQ